MKKSISLIIILSQLCALLAGCQGTDTAPETTADTDATEPATTPGTTRDSLPDDLDFGNQTVTIFAASDLPIVEFEAEQTGDVVDDAVFKRNQLTEEKLGVKIKVENLPDAEYNEMLVKNTNAGEDAYDLYQTYISRGATYAKNGYFLDWRTVDYVKDNLDREWWNQGGLRELSFHSKVYLLNGDISYLPLGNTTALLFNKKVFDDKGLEFLEAADLRGFL